MVTEPRRRWCRRSGGKELKEQWHGSGGRVLGKLRE